VHVAKAIIDGAKVAIARVVSGGLPAAPVSLALTRQWPSKELFEASSANEGPPKSVTLAMYPSSNETGHVLLEGTVSYPGNALDSAIESAMKRAACQQVLKTWASLNKLESLHHEAISCQLLRVEIAKKPAEKETNRPWIATWSIIVKQPWVARETASRILAALAEPGSKLGMLLPKTLARIPGVGDPSLAGDHGMHETRLPPPLDTAEAFGYEDIDENLKKQKDGLSKRQLELRRQDMMENKMAERAIHAGEEAHDEIEHLKGKIVAATRAHAMALRPRSIRSGPEIIPPDVLVDSEEPVPISPYNDWYPRRGPAKLSFAQASHHLRATRRKD